MDLNDQQSAQNVLSYVNYCYIHSLSYEVNGGGHVTEIANDHGCTKYPGDVHIHTAASLQSAKDFVADLE